LTSHPLGLQILTRDLKTFPKIVERCTITDNTDVGSNWIWTTLAYHINL